MSKAITKPVEGRLTFNRPGQEAAINKLQRMTDAMTFLARRAGLREQRQQNKQEDITRTQNQQIRQKNKTQNPKTGIVQLI